MGSTYKNIFSLLLLVAGLVIFSHSVIPHDHHYDIACDTEHHEQHDDTDSPMHCHFLNEVVFDHAIISFNQRFIKNFSAIQALLYRLNNDDVELISKHILLSNPENLPDYLVFIEASPSRGSPSLLS